MKRYRSLKAKPGQLVAYWGKDEDGEGPDLCYAWGGEGANKRDGNMLHDHLAPLFRELKARGFDLNTFKFSISRPAPSPNPGEPHP